MKDLVILGAGTAGTIAANCLQRKIGSDWRITIIDQDSSHYYQPGFLFLPFGVYERRDLVKKRWKLFHGGISCIEAKIIEIDVSGRHVLLERGTRIPYDLLIVATGVRTAPERTEGLTGPDWRKKVFDFYTHDGALALREGLGNWRGGRLVVHISDTQIKCPVAPLEFTLLVHAWLRKRGLRNRTKLTYVTALPTSFAKHECWKVLRSSFAERDVQVISDFEIGFIDNDRHSVVSREGAEIGYDLLVTVPPNIGDDAISRSGLGDNTNSVPTDPYTLQAKSHENIFVIGDATDLPTSKAGSVAHYEAHVLTRNIMHHIQGEQLENSFDGHATCFIESGYGKAFLIDFNYDTPPLPGHFPLPLVGPFSLLKETRINHWGKLAFRWVYWNMLLKGQVLPAFGYRMRGVETQLLRDNFAIRNRMKIKQSLPIG